MESQTTEYNSPTTNILSTSGMSQSTLEMSSAEMATGEHRSTRTSQSSMESTAVVSTAEENLSTPFTTTNSTKTMESVTSSSPTDITFQPLITTENGTATQTQNTPIPTSMESQRTQHTSPTNNRLSTSSLSQSTLEISSTEMTSENIGSTSTRQTSMEITDMVSTPESSGSTPFTTTNSPTTTESLPTPSTTHITSSPIITGQDVTVNQTQSTSILTSMESPTTEDTSPTTNKFSSSGMSQSTSEMSSIEMSTKEHGSTNHPSMDSTAVVSTAEDHISTPFTTTNSTKTMESVTSSSTTDITFQPLITTENGTVNQTQSTSIPTSMESPTTEDTSPTTNKLLTSGMSQTTVDISSTVATTGYGLSTSFTTRHLKKTSESAFSTSTLDTTSSSGFTTPMTMIPDSTTERRPSTQSETVTTIVHTQADSQSTPAHSSTSNVILTTFTTISTTHQCNEEDCHCHGAACSFNDTLGLCQCHCSDSTFGDMCIYGSNVITVSFDKAVPTRKANVSLRIMREFETEYENMNSSKSQILIKTLIKELSALCRRADPDNFKDVKVINLKPGSIVAESIAEYTYPNNASQIDFLNNELEPILRNILNNTDNLMIISQAFENVRIQITNITFQPMEIRNISDLRSFVACRLGFANYTEELSDGSWKCYESSLEQYDGPQCERFRRGRGFYAALFGALGAGILLILVLIVVIVVLQRNRGGRWNIDKPPARRLMSLKEDFFDFTQRGMLISASMSQ
ncbi:mucin-5AC [Oncorhynchus keta]|uniref:mucin-5AC n=1 Tax=Oncorhynchus keta TaxID=8018 RepID=UPI00227B17A5|nr:mucin-5AC [Oncorhynchus keta]